MKTMSLGICAVAFALSLAATTNEETIESAMSAGPDRMNTR